MGKKRAGRRDSYSVTDGYIKESLHSKVQISGALTNPESLLSSEKSCTSGAL